MPTSKKELSVDEICLILKQCGKSQVAVLKYGDLYVRFGKTTPAEAASAPVESDPHPVPATEIAATQQKAAESSLVQNEVALREDQVEMMVIEDPKRAEELIIQGELESGAEFDAETDDDA